MVIFTVVKERQSPAFWSIWMASGLMRTENFLYKMWIMNNLPTSETISELEVNYCLWKFQGQLSNSLKNSHFRNQAKCKTFLVTVSFIFISMALHVASLWNRGFGQVENGLFYILMINVSCSLICLDLSVFRKRRDRRLLPDHKRLRAFSNGGGGPQVGEETCFGWVNRLSI